jgi:predicted GNAT family N-acyltransferase
MTLEIAQATTPADKAAVIALRWRVFHDEQGIDPAIDFDGHDDSYPLFLGKKNGEPVATIRLHHLDAATAKLERLCVDKTCRGEKYGEAMMHFIHQHLRQNGYQEVVLNAQAYLRQFYLKLGYHAVGEEFVEADIPHIKMQISLN